MVLMRCICNGVPADLLFNLSTSFVTFLVLWRHTWSKIIRKTLFLWPSSWLWDHLVLKMSTQYLPSPVCIALQAHLCIWIYEYTYKHKYGSYMMPIGNTYIWKWRWRPNQTWALPHFARLNITMDQTIFCGIPDVNIAVSESSHPTTPQPHPHPHPPFYC